MIKLVNKNIRLSIMARNLILLDRGLRIIREFKRKDIKFLVLKGFYFAFSIYPEIGSRPMIDIDLLVRKNDINKTTKILTELGYSQPFAQNKSKFAYDIPFKNKNTLIDIIWDLCQYERFKGIIDITDDFWNRACEFQLDGLALRTLSTEDHILYISLHYSLLHLLQGTNTTRDLFYLINNRPVNWKDIIDNAYKYKIAIPLYYALLNSTQATELKLPESILPALKPPFLKRALLAFLIPRHKKRVPRYFAQALMVGDYTDSFRVFFRVVKGSLRVFKKSLTKLLYMV